MQTNWYMDVKMNREEISRRTAVIPVLLVRRVIILSLIAILAIIAVIVVSLGASLETSHGQLDEAGLIAAHTFDDFLGSIEDDLLATSDSLATTRDTNSVFQRVLGRQPVIFELLLVDPQGQVLVQRRRVGKAEPALTEQPWLDTVQAGQSYIGSVDYSEFGLPFVDIAVAVTDEAGDFSATLLASVDLTTLWGATTKLKIGETGYVYVVDDKGQLLVYRNLQLVQQGSTLENEVGRSPQEIIASHTDYYIGLGGERVIAAGVPLTVVPWFVIVEQPIDEALRFFAWLAMFLLALLIVMGMLVYSIIVFTRSRIVSPLVLLRQGVDVLRQGNFGHRIAIQTEDEFGTLARTFNSMGAQLQETIDTLEQRVRERTRRLEVVASVSEQLNAILDVDRLLISLVNQIKESFDYYHVHIYTLKESETGPILAMRAGVGEAGAKMKAAKHQIPMSVEKSLVTRAARTGEVVSIENVGDVDYWQPNPLLPETRAEMTVPIIREGQVLGVLDVQSDTIAGLDDSDAKVLRTLAGHIAVALTNARLFEQSQRAKERAEVAQAEAELANQAKSTFLSNMSHELRTPLNAIINFVEMIALGMIGPVNEQQKDLLEQSVNSSTHLLSLINDILDISKIQSGHLKLFIEPDVNLYDELNTAIEIAKPLLDEKIALIEKPVQLVEDVDNNLPIIAGDKRRIRQVFLNLLTNAIKFTDEGTITVSAKNQGDRVSFVVIDTGPGIPEEAQSMIFEPFVQTLDGIKLEQGTGLGLSISRTLAHSHGGDLWVESQPGQGAAFYFTLPTVGSSKNTGK